MDDSNALKTLIRKYSPSKSKNKPLPQAPTEQQSPTRKPIQPISGNASPSKAKKSDKLRSLLKNKPLPPVAVDVQPPSHDHSHSKHKRSVSASVSARREPLPPPISPRAGVRKRPAPKRASPDLHRLSQKVSDLEAQLKDARQQLDSYASARSRRASMPAVNTADLSQIRSVGSTALFEGLVENLLNHGDTLTTAKPLTRDSASSLASGPQAWEQLRNAAADDDCPPSTHDAAQQQHKRKRSELRKASWEQIQAHLSSVPTERDAKRSRRESAYYHRDLPAPLFSGDRGRSAFEDAETVEALFPAVPRLVPAPAGQQRASSAPARHRRTVSLDGFASVSEDDRRDVAVQRQTANYTTFVDSSDDEEEEDVDDFFAAALAGRRRSSGGGGGGGGAAGRPSSPSRRHAASPSRLERVEEEFEWNDEEIF